MQDTKDVAVGLYVMLARDAGDFIDALPTADVDNLKMLLQMLTLPNPKHDNATRDLNKLGAKIVRGELRSRGVEV